MKPWTLKVKVFKEGKYWIAYCKAINHYASGKTQKQAQKHFIESLSILFEEWLKNGNLEQSITFTQ